LVGSFLDFILVDQVISRSCLGRIICWSCLNWPGHLSILS